MLMTRSRLRTQGFVAQQIQLLLLLKRVRKGKTLLIGMMHAKRAWKIGAIGAVFLSNLCIGGTCYVYPSRVEISKRKQPHNHTHSRIDHVVKQASTFEEREFRLISLHTDVTTQKPQHR